LALATGTPASTAVNYSSGSGTNTLIFNYTVAAGNTSSDLNYVGTTSLTLNGGTIKDAAGNNATLTLPGLTAAGSLGTNKSIVIDTTAPTSAVTSPASGVIANTLGSVSGTASDTGGSGVASVVISLKRNFSDNHYWNGSDWSSATEVFLSADNTTSWSKISGLPTGADLLDGSYTVRSRATDNASNVQTPGAANNFTVDQTGPSLTVVTGPPNGSYRAGQNLDFTATYDENVVVTGTPRIGVTIGGNARNASYVSGSGTTALVFRYTVVSGDNGGVVSISPINLNGGTINDAGAN